MTQLNSIDGDSDPGPITDIENMDVGDKKKFLSCLFGLIHINWINK